MTTQNESDIDSNHRRIIGVDFSGAANAGQKIWVVEGHEAHGVLEIDALQPGYALPNSGVEREKAIPALLRYLQLHRNAIAGFDFPFALHHEQMPEDWDRFATETAQHDTPEEFRNYYCSLVENKELKRSTDIETRTPLAPTNLRIYRQTFYGIRDLLLPLVKSGARVLPFHEPEVGALHLIEICPASLLKREKLYLSYKGRSAHQSDARTRIYEMLHERYGMRASADILALAVDDPEGDALDSVLAAIITWRALQQPAQFYPRPESADAIEGRVYC